VSKSCLMVLILLSLFFSNSVYAEAPFTLKVNPIFIEAKPGEQVTYTINITVNEAFNESIDLDLNVKVLSFNESYSRQIDPPYPYIIEYTLTIPSDIPLYSQATAHLVASFDGDIVEEVIVLRIVPKNRLLNILDGIFHYIMMIIYQIKDIIL
jgi:hypothetical protein